MMNNPILGVVVHEREDHVVALAAGSGDFECGLERRLAHYITLG